MLMKCFLLKLDVLEDTFSIIAFDWDSDADTIKIINTYSAVQFWTCQVEPFNVIRNWDI
jgi:hypothetical protein